MPLQRRKVQVAVVSDLHLGMRGCHAQTILAYLKSIEPEVLILNGDIIDIWQFKKKYFPPAHMQVVRELLSMIARGKKVYYITGNHDELFRRFIGFKVGNFELVNKVVLELDGKRAWFFHGDVFDVTMQYSKWLTKLGGKGYDLLIWFNQLINGISMRLGHGRISLSKKVKESVKGAVQYINQFETVAAEIAISNGYDYVVCGHIHQPADRTISTEKGRVRYLNSGDWVENCTALEYHEGQWRIHHQPDATTDSTQPSVQEPKIEALFDEMLLEFSMKNASAV
jgi:UDP-2,3-diacylglucosamine pyrophosphatase LpxH